MNFDLQSYLKDIKSRQNSRYHKSQPRTSIDTESLFTDRSDAFSPSHHSHLNHINRQVAVKVIEIQKPYILEDYFPKTYKPTEKFTKSIPLRSSSVLSHNKENLPGQKPCSRAKAKDWGDDSLEKISSRNPLVSFDYRSDTSPSPNLNHNRRQTADFPQPYKPKKREPSQSIPLTLCTCILSGKLYRHLRGCRKVEVVVIKGKVTKKLSVLEACIKIQRQVRKHFKDRRSALKDSIDFPFFVDVSKCRPKQFMSSVLESYSFSKDSESLIGDFESDRFMDRIIPGQVFLKNFPNESEESIDFELSNTFK